MYVSIGNAMALNKIPFNDPNFAAGVAATAGGAVVSPSPSKKQMAVSLLDISSPR